MDKFIDVFVKQNPYITIDCPNCGYKQKLQSKKFFDSSANSIIKCQKCKKEIELDYIKRDFKSAKKQLEKMCK